MSRLKDHKEKEQKRKRKKESNLCHPSILYLDMIKKNDH